MTKQRIVILGGGLGGVTAAFYLTSTAELRARYDVTLLQQGWRLGGKGATGRNPRLGERIQEHGLHMFMGFYENAFHTMRLCFDEWQRPSNHPWQSLDDAFKPQYRITLQERVGSRWETWNIDAPWLPGQPGVDDALGVLGSLDARIKAALDYLQRALSDLPLASAAVGALRRLGDLFARFGVDVMTSRLSLGLLTMLLRDAQIATAAVVGLMGHKLESRPLERRGLYLLQLALSIAHGYVTEVLPHEVLEGGKAFDRINDRELRAFLRQHHCPEHVLDWAPLKALYDLGFAYEKGDASSASNGNIAAGVGLKVLLRLPLAYKGAPLFRMRAGMGDTIFVPMYQVLAERGVKFRFFNRVNKLQLSTDGRRIHAVEVDVQADALVAGCSYRPLVGVGDLQCWPSEPLWGQLDPATPRVDFESAWCTQAVRSETLVDGADFDLAVLAISKAALEPIVGDLALRPRWRAMLDLVPTVMTQAAQVWLREPTAKLGFDGTPTVMTSYVEPFDSWADMSEVLAHEAWPESVQAKSVQYLCSPRAEPAVSPVPPSDPGFPAAQAAEVKGLLRVFLDSKVAHLWPRAMLPGGGFDDALLVDPEERVGAARLEAQYWRANVEPTERYVQSFAGTIAARLDADNGPTGSGVENLFLAGDWIRTGLNAGSAEAAVESGMLASRAICGVPERVVDTP